MERRLQASNLRVQPRTHRQARLPLPKPPWQESLVLLVPTGSGKGGLGTGRA